MYMLCKKYFYFILFFLEWKGYFIICRRFSFLCFGARAFLYKTRILYFTRCEEFFFGWKLLIFFCWVIAQTLNVGYFEGGFYGTLVDDVWNFQFFIVVLFKGEFSNIFVCSYGLESCIYLRIFIFFKKKIVNLNVGIAWL